MSFMYLLAADRALPDRDYRTERTVDCGKYIEHGDLGFAIEKCYWSHHGMTPEGRPHGMGHVKTKPYLYNIELVPNDAQTLRDLKAYLREVLSPENALSCGTSGWAALSTRRARSISTEI